MDKIITKRLILRKFNHLDYIKMYENWASDVSVAEKAGWPVHRDIEKTRQLVESWISEYDDIHTFNWIITLRDNNEPIGSISVVTKDIKNKVCEIGYNIGVNWWNHGYVTEAISEVVKYLFETGLFEVISASCFEDNDASRRVLEKNGFVYEGTLRKRVIQNNKRVSLLQFSILKEEYLRLSSK